MTQRLVQMPYIKLEYNESKVSCFFVVFFEFYNFFVSFSKCESILDRGRTQVPTETNA